MRHSPHPTATEINERKKKSTKNLVFLKFVFVYNFINKKKTLTNFEVMFVKIKEKIDFFPFCTTQTMKKREGGRSNIYLDLNGYPFILLYINYSLLYLLLQIILKTKLKTFCYLININFLSYILPHCVPRRYLKKKIKFAKNFTDRDERSICFNF